MTAIAAAGCGGPPGDPRAAPPATASRGQLEAGAPEEASAALRPASAHIQTVFMILLENHNWDDITGSSSAPYINGKLLPIAARAENYHGDAHPSEPNYLWLVAGDSFGVSDDGPPASNTLTTSDHLAARLNAAGISWRSYQESISGTECPLRDLGAYRTKHNPFVFFSDLTGGGDPSDADCIAHNRPLTELAGDLQKRSTARFNFITPNQCHDMHDSCPPTFDQVREGDDWLASVVPQILASAAYQQGGALFITWDESRVSASCPDDDCPIGMMVVSPFARAGHASTSPYDHSSTLRTVQEIFGAQPMLRAAAGASDLSDLFTQFP